MVTQAESDSSTPVLDKDAVARLRDAAACPGPIIVSAYDLRVLLTYLDAAQAGKEHAA